jgi:hypothetical protein
MFAVGKDLVLQRQERAARIHQVHTRQPVLERHFLRAQMLFHGEGEIRAALHGGVVRDHHDLAAVHASDAGDDSSGRRRAVV